MADVRGQAVFAANGEDYKLHVGFSVLAELQAKHGQDVLERLEPPAGANENWMPDMGIIIDLVVLSLDRHHADVADRYLADDLIAQNSDLLGELFTAAFPDRAEGDTPGKRRKAKAA